MKVDLYFKNALVGFLSKKEEKFLFELNEEGYESVKHFPSVMVSFENENLVCGEYDAMPSFFMNEFVNNIKERSDIKKSAAIEEGDDDMTILYKFAALKQNDYKFHLKQG